MSSFDCEPCDTCSTGIAKFTSWDGKRRCSSCIIKLVKQWNASRMLPPMGAPKRVRRKPESDEGQETLF